jgi:hypothetical protein
MSVRNGLAVRKPLCQFEGSIGVKYVTVQALLDMGEPHPDLKTVREGLER